ncbi:OSCP/delta subunit of ATPase [Phlyctochytrium arcticum]|nr:OSCP/delta subunit of ATPase [Phlyctochytrium arcticum]
MHFLRATVGVAKAAPLAQAARSYATAAQTVQVPLVLHGISGRYATALYSAASKKGGLETVQAELAKLKQTLDKDTKAKSSLENPLVDRKAKKAAVQALLGAKSSDITRNFFDTLAENGRLDQTTKVLAAFEDLMAATRREVSVTVVSAKELDAKTTKQLQATLQKSNLVEKDSKLMITNKVDPNILGGLIVDFGDKTIDLSVASKLSKLNRLLTEAV